MHAVYYKIQNVVFEITNHNCTDTKDHGAR